MRHSVESFADVEINNICLQRRINNLVVPWLNLLLAIQVSDIKKLIHKVTRIYSSCDSQQTYSTSNTK